MNRLMAAAVSLALLTPAIALAQYKPADPAIGTRIGTPEYGGGYRELPGRRIGPRDTSGLRPYDARSRVGGEEFLLPRVAAGPPRAGSSAAARRAARERYLRQEALRRAAPPANKAPAFKPPAIEPNSY